MIRLHLVSKWAVVLLALMATTLMVATVSAAGEIDPGDSPVAKRIVDNGILRVGVNPQFKPFSFKTPDNRQAGVDIDIAKLLARQLGVKLEIVVPGAFSQLIPMLLSDQIDIIMAGMTINFKRAKVVNFTDPYFNTGLSILLNKVKAGRLGLSGVSSYQEMMESLAESGREDKLIIAVTKGKSPARSVPVYFPKAQVREYASNEEAAQAVADGKAHIMVHDEIFLKVWVNDHKDTARFKLTVFPRPFKPDHYGFAVRKGNQELVNMLNVFISELYVEDYINRFMTTYLPPQVKPAKFDVGESEL